MAPARYLCSAVMALAAVALPSAPGAHCPGAVPKVEMLHPSEGVAIQKACYPDFGTCFTDTFHAVKLQAELAARFKAARHAVFAYIDSVSDYLVFDTAFYRGSIHYIDTFQAERIRISIHRNLKDTLPARHLVFEDRWLSVPGNPNATTYRHMVDTPFVAFFDAYDGIGKLGIGPMDGCFFEPTVYAVSGDRIHKKGLAGERMPGVSVRMDDFFQAIGRDPVEAPRVRAKDASIHPRGMRIRDPRGGFPYRYDLIGRRMRGHLGPPHRWESRDSAVRGPGW